MQLSVDLRQFVTEVHLDKYPLARLRMVFPNDIEISVVDIESNLGYEMMMIDYAKIDPESVKGVSYELWEDVLPYLSASELNDTIYKLIALEEMK